MDQQCAEVPGSRKTLVGGDRLAEHFQSYRMKTMRGWTWGTSIRSPIPMIRASSSSKRHGWGVATRRTSFLIERASFSSPPSSEEHSSCDAAVEVIAVGGSTSVPFMSTSVLPSLLMSEPRLDVSENLDESSGCTTRREVLVLIG
jgi:hypothetical protein